MCVQFCNLLTVDVKGCEDMLVEGDGKGRDRGRAGAEESLTQGEDAGEELSQNLRWGSRRRRKGGKGREKGAGGKEGYSERRNIEKCEDFLSPLVRPHPVS